MPELEFRDAVRDALDEELAHDDRVIFFGEDVASVQGGVFATTQGLQEKYGSDRVFDTPISELAITGAAYGSAVCGLRPVIETLRAWGEGHQERLSCAPAPDAVETPDRAA